MSQAERRLQHTRPACVLTPKSTQSLSEIQISVGLLDLSGGPDCPPPPLAGSWAFPSFPLQTVKVVRTLSCCLCARTPTGRAPQSGLLVPDGIRNVAGFRRLPFIRVPSVYTPTSDVSACWFPYSSAHRENHQTVGPLPFCLVRNGNRKLSKCCEQTQVENANRQTAGFSFWPTSLLWPLCLLAPTFSTSCVK